MHNTITTPVYTNIIEQSSSKRSVFIWDKLPPCHIITPLHKLNGHKATLPCTSVCVCGWACVHVNLILTMYTES